MSRLPPPPLYLRELPGAHRRGGWVGPRAGLDGCGKSGLRRFFFIFSCALYFVLGSVSCLLYVQHLTQTSMPPAGFELAYPAN